MTDVHDPAPLLEAAEKAVADGDYPAAERLLREAAASQEATLGPRHADLAATLNNLAFVCERTNKLEDAERGYRRAHAIAVASLGPGHPFVGTSLRNLVAFCSTHGIPVWKPPVAVLDDRPAAEGEAADVEAAGAISEFETEAEAQADDAVSSVEQETAAAQPEPRRAPAGVAASLVGVAALVVVAVVAWRGTTGPVAPSADSTRPAGEQSPVPAASAPAAVLEPEPEPRRQPRPEPEPARDEPPVPTTATVAPPAPESDVGARVVVLRAQLCGALERTGSPDWQCTPAGGELGPGAVTFYTRLLTDAVTTVEHRWYHGDRLHQVMRLRVTPSPERGYRTYSRNTVSPDRVGDWKVELRAADGTLLREEPFVVR